MHLQNKIISELAERRTAENLIANICKSSSPDMDDLAQSIYESLLKCDDKKIADLYQHGQLIFFIVRIIQNQYFSKTSAYYREIKRFASSSVSLDKVRYRHDE